jgi:hypothetical protein
MFSMSSNATEDTQNIKLISEKSGNEEPRKCDVGHGRQATTIPTASEWKTQ